MQSNTKTSIMIVGGNGHLGSLITKYCLMQPNLQVSIMTKHTDKNKEIMDQVQKAGGKIMVADITKPETLKDTTKGIHTIISAISCDEPTIIDAQNNLLQDAIKNGVKRFIPSDYSMPLDKVTQDDNPVFLQKMKFRQSLEKSSVKGLYVYPGIFTETFFMIMSQMNPGLHYYGNADQKIDITSYEDTAKFVAAAVSKLDRTGDLMIRGDELSVNQMAEIYNRVTGKSVMPECYGTLDELKKRMMEMRTKDMPKSITMNYELLMFDGRGKLPTIQNSEFPEVKVMTFEEYVKTYPQTAVFPQKTSIQM